MNATETNSLGRRKYYRPGVNKPSLYPWEKWFARGTFTLVAGKDFFCTLPGMTVNVRAAAAGRGLRVRIDQKPDRLVVTVK